MARRTRQTGRLWEIYASEIGRSAAALLLAAAVTLVVAVQGRRVGQLPDLSWFMPVFQASYVGFTWVLLCSNWERLSRWAERSREPNWRQRYVYLTEPGTGLSTYAAFLALGSIAAVVADRQRHLNTGAIVAAISLVVSSWLTILLSFALDYLRTDARRGWRELDIPDAAGRLGRRASDYIYFATAVSTTFGTTDVTVRSRRLRRTISMHAIVAFVFNTVILALVIATVTT